MLNSKKSHLFGFLEKREKAVTSDFAGTAFVTRFFGLLFFPFFQLRGKCLLSRRIYPVQEQLTTAQDAIERSQELIRKKV